MKITATVALAASLIGSACLAGVPAPKINVFTDTFITSRHVSTVWMPGFSGTSLPTYMNTVKQAISTDGTNYDKQVSVTQVLAPRYGRTVITKDRMVDPSTTGTRTITVIDPTGTSTNTVTITSLDLTSFNAVIGATNVSALYPSSGYQVKTTMSDNCNWTMEIDNTVVGHVYVISIYFRVRNMLAVNDGSLVNGSSIPIGNVTMTGEHPTLVPQTGQYVVTFGVVGEPGEIYLDVTPKVSPMVPYYGWQIDLINVSIDPHMQLARRILDNPLPGMWQILGEPLPEFDPFHRDPSPQFDLNIE